MSVLTVGVVGCGKIARKVHLPLLARMPAVRVAALADSEPRHLAEARVRAPGAAAHSGVEELLRAGGAEAVVVCLPSGLHAAAASAVLSAGRHLYLEKPLSADLRAAREVLALWEGSGLVGMMGYNYRFHPHFRAARKRIASGRLGELLMLRGVFTVSGAADGWRRSPREGGGALPDLASHHIDLARFLLDDEVAEVGASLRSRRTEQDTAALQLRMRGGALVQLSAAYGACDEDRIEIHGTEGTLAVDRYRTLSVQSPPSRGIAGRVRTLVEETLSPASWRYLAAKARAPWHEPSYGLALAHFVEAVRSGRPASPDLLDGYRALEVVEAAERSARTGATVVLDPKGREAARASVLTA